MFTRKIIFALVERKKEQTKEISNEINRQMNKTQMKLLNLIISYKLES
jgi:hypothetical protein